MTLTVKCPLCGKVHIEGIDRTARKEYLCGKHIQDAFPDLSASDREAIKAIMTGICDDCFPKEED